MASHSRNFLPPYDFGAALSLKIEERFSACVDRIRQSHTASGYTQLAWPPPIPTSGASQEEVEQLEHHIGASLPSEYAQFLRRWRYLDIDSGLNIWGFADPNEGVSLGTPWLSDEHRQPYKYLVFGDYWNYADGDQLMFDLSQPDTPVVVYLHDYGPSIEYFAPSFSLALWRLANEGS